MRWAHLYFSDVRFLPDVSRHLVTLFSVLISNFGRVIQKTKRVTGGGRFLRECRLTRGSQCWFSRITGADSQ